MYVTHQKHIPQVAHHTQSDVLHASSHQCVFIPIDTHNDQ